MVALAAIHMFCEHKEIARREEGEKGRFRYGDSHGSFINRVGRGCRISGNKKAVLCGLSVRKARHKLAENLRGFFHKLWAASYNLLIGGVILVEPAETLTEHQP